MKDLLDDTPARTLWNGADYRTILSAAETGGSLAIVDAFHEPRTGPGRHIHEVHDEVFVVLSGRMRFWVEGATFERGPGGTAFVPRGADHTFQVVGPEGARFLAAFTPAGFEGFLEDWIARRWRWPEDMDAVSEAASRHRLVFTGPPIEA